MNDAERIWRLKTDEELVEAAGELEQFTEAGQVIIRAELRRRGLEDPVEQAVGAAAEDAEDAEPLACLRCRAPLEFINRDERTRERYLPWGSLPLVEAGGMQIYACPRCGHVELFLNPPVDGTEPDETE
jgi:hypothetical protein